MASANTSVLRTHQPAFEQVRSRKHNRNDLGTAGTMAEVDQATV